MKPEIKSLFVPYELALKLKEKMCYVPCIAYYTDNNVGDLVFYAQEKTGNPYTSTNKTFAHPHAVHMCSAPTYDQVIRFFREKKIRICETPQKTKRCWIVIEQYNPKARKEAAHVTNKGFLTLDGAIEEALKRI